ncbi:MAG: phospholipid/glycerol acyltransferase [Bacteroidetes bacterium]|nr:MAG: phospholipid/glycerol acyltransferase [Bacteroidota bacterium]
MKYLFNRFLWVLFNITLGTFYRFKVWKHAEGRENIPRNKPILFCSNHPNAFMDALLVATTVPRQTYFLVRSDVFKPGWKAKALEFLYLIPVYRIQEGVENLQKNDETFRICNMHLKNKQSIIIFSEGICVQERRLRRLKKGTARIAFGAEEAADFRLGLTIVPVGVNYTDKPWKFREPLHIRFGKPFELSEYAEKYKTEKPRTINEFTARLEKEMAELLVIIKDKENDELVAGLEDMFLDVWTREGGRDPQYRRQDWKSSREIADTINKATAQAPDQVAALREQVASYFSKIEKHKLRDWLLREETIKGMTPFGVGSQVLIFFLGWPLFLAGALMNLVPFYVPYRIAEKIVRNKEWHASVNATIGSFLWFFWYLLVWILTWVFTNWWIALSVLFVMYPLGRFAWWFRTRWKKFRGSIRLLSLVSNESAKVEELLKQRAQIKTELDLLRKTYMETGS